MKAKTKRKQKPAKLQDSLFRQFPKKRELGEDEINTWIDVALTWGAIFYVDYGGTQVEMHTNTGSIAFEGVFNAFLAYAKAHPRPFAEALFERAKKKPTQTMVVPLANQDAYGYRYIVRQEDRR